MEWKTHGENEHQQLVPWKDKRSGRLCQQRVLEGLQACAGAEHG